MAAGAGPEHLHLARAARRDPGRDGVGGHPPLSILPPCCALWLVGTLRRFAGGDACGIAAAQRGTVRPELTKRPPDTHKRTNREFTRPTERDRAPALAAGSRHAFPSLPVRATRRSRPSD